MAEASAPNNGLFKWPTGDTPCPTLAVLAAASATVHKTLLLQLAAEVGPS